jgi:hypothetical protein
MIDKGMADVIAQAAWSEEISNLDANTLDKLAIYQFTDDPDVEFDELGLGCELPDHGVNTDKEMLKTAKGN